MDVFLHTQHQEAKGFNLGGKASGLIHLESLGANVPPFFVLSSDSFRQHLPEKEWSDFLMEQENLDPQNPTQTLPKAQALCDAIRNKPIDSKLRLQITQAFNAVPASHYAIRSSMLGEDGVEHSFAGQLESFLFQSGIESVLQSIQNCWCSALQNRVLLYRNRAGLLPEDIRVAVVVQKMVNSDVSGVLFTVDPQSGHRSHILVSGAWGQGEGIVSGACNCDEFIWHKQEGELRHTIADKDILFVSDPQSHTGTKEVETAHEQRNIRCLETTHLKRLCERATQLEASFGYPLDIEWAIEDGNIYFLQARPITALPAPPNEDGPVVVWDNSNIQESYCGVTTPLTFSYAQRAYHTVYRQTMEALSIPQKTIDESHGWLRNLLGIVRGRIYYNINNWYKGLSYFPSFGKNKADMEEMMGLKDPVDFIEDQNLGFIQKLGRLPRMMFTLSRLLWAFRQLPRTVPEFQDRFEKICASLSIEQIRTMTFSQLMDLNEQLRLDIQEKWHVPIINDFYVMMSTGGLRRFLSKNGLPNALQLQNHLLAGEPGIESTEPTKILVGLADDLRDDPAFLSESKNLEDAAFYERLQNHTPKTKNILSHYIQRYGDRVMGELKLETETLREDPQFLVQILRNYLQNPKLSLKSLEEQEQKLRRSAEEKVFQALPFWKRNRAKKMIQRMRDSVKNRENMRLTRTRAFGLSRAIYRALGARLVEANRLETMEDIFYLTVDELEAYHEGRSISTDLKGLATIRRAEFDSYEEQDLPHHFQTQGPVYHGNRYQYSGTIEIDPNADVLHGLGCYPGRITAPIQKIMKPEEAHDLQGKILCTVRTDPGWAPLFPSVSGILVERGSTLSHSAVVARELGIPAVVNVPGLTQILEDAEIVTMDGEHGTIERQS